MRDINEDLRQQPFNEEMKHIAYSFAALHRRNLKPICLKLGWRKVTSGTWMPPRSRMEEARNQYQEALRIYREAAQSDPGGYPPYVAMTLNNLGLLDRDQNRMAEARKAYEEALAIYEAFARRDPKLFTAEVERLKKLLEELPK